MNGYIDLDTRPEAMLGSGKQGGVGLGQIAEMQALIEGMAKSNEAILNIGN